MSNAACFMAEALEVRRIHAHRTSRDGRTALSHIVAVLLCLLTLGPVVWLFLTAFNIPSLLSSAGRAPAGGLFSNFTRAIELAPVGNWFAQSLFIALAIAAGKVLISVPAAYALALLRFRGRKSLFVVVVGTMIIPDVITLIPNYIVVSRLGWLDTPQGVIVPMIAFTGFNVFLLRQSMKQVPRELVDAARLDGAGTMRVLWSIVLPLVRPTVVIVGVLSFLSAWNLYLWPQLVLTSEASKTLPVGLQGFAAGQGQANEWGPMMAIGVVAVSLPLVIFVFAQRFLISVLAGASTRETSG